MLRMKTSVAACACALTLAFVAPVASADGSTNSKETNAVTRTEGLPSQTAGDSWNGWVSGYATQHEGRISRDAYMNEMGRRWDSSDRNKEGLTPAEVSHMYGRTDSGAMPPRTGTGVQPGNMGPGNSKAQ